MLHAKGGGMNLGLKHSTWGRKARQDGGVHGD